ncbi:MAG: hypothetical protein EOP10_03420 [Proteobacteria bacterium]|nr:MAG: hypothetical protein EOP10_03420 [Pseudomonadota bacterium]
MKTKLTTTLVTLALLTACSLDRSAPPIPVAQPAPPPKVDPETAGNQIPSTRAPADEKPIEKGEVPGNPAPVKPVVPDPVVTPSPACEESKMVTQSKALTPSFTFNGIAQSLKYELSLLCNGTAMPISQQTITFDLDASMTADNATYDILDATGKVLTTASIIYLEDTDLNGPKPGFYIWSTKALALAAPQTKITLVIKTGVFSFGSFLGATLQTYQRIGTSQFAKTPIAVSK